MADVNLLANYQVRDYLELEEDPLSGSRPQTAPTDLHRHGQGSCENAIEKGNSKNPFSQIHQQTVFSSQKGLDREQSNSGPVALERIHIPKNLQNAHTQRGETLTTRGSLDGFLGPEGWFLPPDGIKEIQALPGVPLQGPELEIQSNALRPKHCAPSFYEGNVVQCPLPNQSRDMGLALPGRHSDHSQDKIRMPSESPESSRDLGGTRMDYQYGEIQTDTTTSFQLARCPLQSTGLYSPKHSRITQSIPNTVEGTFDCNINHQTSDNAVTGTCELARTSQPISSTFPVPNQTTLESPQTSKPRYGTSSEQSNEVPNGKMVNTDEEPSTPRSPKDNMHSLIGCVRDRLGVYTQPGKIPRNFRQLHEKVQYQCPGTPDHLVGLPYDKAEGPHRTHPDGQQYSGRSNKESIVQRQHSGQHSRADLEESTGHELDYIYSSHRREVQHLGRSVVKKHNHLNRVGYPTRYIPEGDFDTRTTSTSGSFCHQSKSQINYICVSLPGSGSSSSRCSVDRMEQMGVYLTLSPQPLDFEGFAETDTISHQDSDLLDPRGTHSTVVLTPQITTNTTACSPHTVATTSGQHSRVTKGNFQNSRLEILKLGNSIKYPKCDSQTLDLISAPVGKSSEKDYQRKWNYFLDFLKQKGIPFNCIIIDVVMQFFSYLFYSKGLKPSTISHYRSALSPPLMIYFNIDLRVKAVRDQLRAMRLQRPNEPSSRPAWSLSKVLTYLESIDTTSIIQSLRKTAFLLLLATGWRISELHACVRDEDFCRFTENSSLIIRPHASFLAKNGLRRRLEPKEIRILKTSEDNVSKICPVTALRTYLNHTTEAKAGCLFLNPKTKKNLSLPQIRQHICSLITEADPDTKAKVHDIRKFAASCSLQQDMLVGDLTEDFNWSSPAVFYKFYFMQTEALQRPVSLPVRN